MYIRKATYKDKEEIDAEHSGYFSEEILSDFQKLSDYVKNNVDRLPNQN